MVLKSLLPRQYQRLTDTPSDVRGRFQPSHFVAPTGILLYTALVVADESSITLSQLPASIFALLFPMLPSGCPFYVLRALHPQLSRATCRPSARARSRHQHNPHPAPVAPFQTEVIQLMRRQLTAMVTTTPSVR